GAHDLLERLLVVGEQDPQAVVRRHAQATPPPERSAVSGRLSAWAETDLRRLAPFLCPGQLPNGRLAACVGCLLLAARCSLLAARGSLIADGCSSAGCSGSRTVKVLPRFGPALTASISPWCWLMIRWLIDSPSPVPLPVQLRVKNGSKMFSSTSAVIPQPV